MGFGAYPPDAPIGGAAPLGVQAGSRFQSAKNTGAFNDCGGVDSDTQRGISRTSEIQPERAGASPRELRKLSSRCNSGPQSPISTLIAVLTVPAIVVAVGLVWSQL